MGGDTAISADTPYENDSATTCSELADMASQMSDVVADGEHAHGAQDHAGGAAGGGASGHKQLRAQKSDTWRSSSCFAKWGLTRGSISPPLYHLRPQYFSETSEAKDSGVTWLGPEDETARSRLRLKVSREGLILGADGTTPLGGHLAHASSSSPRPDDADGTVSDAQGCSVQAIFVMDKRGDLMLTTEHSQGLFHHSSFVAGAPVIAAGEMTIRAGELISLSNHSGHCV